MRFRKMKREVRFGDKDRKRKVARGLAIGKG